jgi:23S rRNA pseudouridine2605 synthase
MVIVRKKSNQESFASFRKPQKSRERKVISPKRLAHEIPKTGHESEQIRLNRYLASTGICSRREADDYIKAGLVTVNGQLVTEMGVKIKPGDEVKYNGEALREEKKIYILLNKPKDYVTTVEDPHAKKTVLELIKGACKERVYPVGRLDRNTTGVLLLTNDGDLTKKLTHPKYERLKIYHVHLNKSVKHGDLEKIATGVHLEDGVIKADAVSYADATDKSQVGIEIHSGRNHIVRRIFESLGYEVIKLDRVYFAGLTKKNLHRGEWRLLSEKEVSMLKMNAFK